MKRVFGLFIVMLFGIGLVGCSGYGYRFHFDVIDGNGKITIKTEISERSIVPCSKKLYSCDLNCAESSHVAQLLGGKKGYRELTFLAIPDEGYQVKEWLFNGEIVEGNKTNTYIAKVSSSQNYNGVILVRFELIG